MAITTAEIKALRDLTGAGIMDSKRALEDADGDMDKAQEILREKGIASAAKKSDRETDQGLVESYIHSGGRIGAMVEANCETTSWPERKTLERSRTTSQCRLPR